MYSEIRQIVALSIKYLHVENVLFIMIYYII